MPHVQLYRTSPRSLKMSVFRLVRRHAVPDKQYVIIRNSNAMMRIATLKKADVHTQCFRLHPRFLFSKLAT
jgi:hypothetical protein